MTDYHRRESTTGVSQRSVSPGSGSQSQPGAAQHKRVYQACIPCRRRKVRCDLGSVDNPNDPPCVRCRRESKECYFSATRRKRKTDDGEDLDGYHVDHQVDDYIIRNGRKRVYTGAAAPSPTRHAAPDRRSYSDAPPTFHPSSVPVPNVRREPLRRPEPARSSIASTGRASTSSRQSDFVSGAVDDSDARVENVEAQNVMRMGVYGTHDALDLLYKAATDGPDAATTNPDERAAPAARAMPTQQPTRPTPSVSRMDGRDSRAASGGAGSVKMEPPIDPELMKRNLADDPGYLDAIKAWGRFRFVRAGWFSAQEAIEYIEYYYEYLSPLTPISPPTFRNPGSHHTLLTEEPILTVTLLTIASRYHKPPGTGSESRSAAIHEQLWTYLRGMIERCLWGQEAFGNRMFPLTPVVAGESQTSSTAPWRGMRKGSLRTLGTIESLMILTEWHPRALHFPAPEAIDELMLPSYDEGIMAEEEHNQHLGNVGSGVGVGGRRIDSWLEPAWRSDRMCWMLLSTATGLAYELGVFDDIDELLRDGAITRPEYEEEAYRQRAYRIKRLMLIYVTQLAGRLGWTNMVSESLRRSDPAVSRRRPASSVEGTTPGTNPSSFSNSFNYIPDLELDDQVIHCWAGISNAMHISNEKLFRSRHHTTKIIQSGKYLDLLNEFRPILDEWHNEFERFRLPPFIRHILKIEYEYVRIYANSLSLQAVVERCTNNAGNTAGGGGTSGGSGSAAQLSPQTQNYFGKLPLGQLGGLGTTDQEYIREVVVGCRRLLKTVVDDLLPGGYLKHAPVRTYFRIISGAMFLLKTFALGAPRADVKTSIDLMDETVAALRNCVVDDVHLGIRFADLLDSLTSRLRNRFIQAPTIAQAASASGDRSPNVMEGAGGGGGGANGANGVVHVQDGGWADADRPGSPSAAGISATPFDLSTGTFPYPSGAVSAMNPSTPAALDNILDGPGGGGGGGGGGSGSTSANANGNQMSAFGDDWNTPGNEMWYLPPGPAFFQNMGDSAVAMTAEGVNVGGMDLLEYMVMDQGLSMDAPPFGA
ncbi:related to ARO80 - positive transcription regulator of ARO9 and ARO10 [Cephalotrichum gorgonifer]|uniref:Related to ARO80 - positive transcription regulator of ARO9 and ARO10 n=1 Tax=Cephalotrichum gorgonifer TaxID=2041049 RepID=A0AAE8N102_9PEZI|nr:related to ARO80 - positive transcription regulator of ARO9 and ARO10 [Cephalotrichum gorgonifer]